MNKRQRKKQIFEPKRFYRTGNRYISEAWFDIRHETDFAGLSYPQRKKAIYKLKNKEVNKC